MNLESLYVEDIYFYSWWIILASKLTLPRSMKLVIDTSIEVKMAIRTNTFILTLLFWYLSWDFLIVLSPEVWTFACYGTRRYFEGVY